MEKLKICNDYECCGYRMLNMGRYFNLQVKFLENTVLIHNLCGCR